MRKVVTVVAVSMLALVAVVPATAHEERASQFPAGTGEPPAHRTIDEAADVLVVCKPESGSLITRLPDAQLRAFNEQLLSRCRYEHLQAAVNAVTRQRTNIYVLPGHYREEPSWDPPCTAAYDGGVVDYDLIVSCGEVINLVTVAGDDPNDDDIVCDNALCHLQIEGTGAEPTHVVFTGGFRDNGDWVKHNGIKADRADGFYLANMTWELFRENAIYVHETDGYTLDRVVARFNDLYGILTFTSDHGVIKHCETHHNGDSGIYPGSAADVNADSTTPPPLTRWSVEIFGCDTHHNALGFSGTAGNSVYFHDNIVHLNGAGYVTDSFVGGHPGMPQDHAWLENNRIYNNNENYYVNVQGDDPPCQRGRPADRGYERGTVCPAFPVPVGTGVLIAGGNYNLVRNNQIYDNWRAGAMMFWVPGAIRGDLALEDQLDTSNGNQFRDNRLGLHPSGVAQPNGVDFWWDDQGLGNCWQDNVSSAGEPTHNAVLPLPDCSTGSLTPVGNVIKSAGLVPCATYNREDEPDPAGCDWFTLPAEPAGRVDAPDDHEHVLPRWGAPVIGGPDGETEDDDVDGTPATGGGALIAVLGASLAGLAATLRRRRARVS